MKIYIPAFFICWLSLTLLFSCGDAKEKEKAPEGIDSLVKVKSHRPGSDIENGEVEERFSNGIIHIKGYKVKGKREGLWRSWYSNGQLNSELGFVNDKREGPYGVWHENGKKMVEGAYRNDIAVGKWKYWENTGKLVKEVDFSNPASQAGSAKTDSVSSSN